MKLLTNLQYTINGIFDIYRIFLKRNLRLLILFTIFLALMPSLLYAVAAILLQTNIFDTTSFIGGYIGQTSLVNPLSVMMCGLFAAFLQRITLDEKELKFNNIFSFITKKEILLYFVVGIVLMLVSLSYETSSFRDAFDPLLGEAVFTSDIVFGLPTILETIFKIVPQYILAFTPLVAASWLLAKNYGKIRPLQILGASITSYLVISFSDVFIKISFDALIIINELLNELIGRSIGGNLNFILYMLTILGLILLTIPIIAGALHYSNEFYVEDNDSDEQSSKPEILTEE